MICANAFTMTVNVFLPCVYCDNKYYLLLNSECSTTDRAWKFSCVLLTKVCDVKTKTQVVSPWQINNQDHRRERWDWDSFQLVFHSSSEANSCYSVIISLNCSLRSQLTFNYYYIQLLAEKKSIIRNQKCTKNPNDLQRKSRKSPL